MAPREPISFVETILDRYQRLTTERLFTYLPDKEPRRHLYDLLASYPSRKGKGLRPGLCIATCRAFGGEDEDALATAVAIELFHNAFLIHDDVEDGSEERRGAPTLNAQYGIPIAVNVGDAMNVISIRPLMSNLDHLGPTLTWQVFEEIEHMVKESVEGQAMELSWVHENACELGPQDYLRMTLKKTCWYTCIHPCRLGALIAQGARGLDRFNLFAYYMGAAFQIQDDLLNLVGERERYGKEIGGDIWEGKRTMALIHLLSHCRASDKKRIRRFLSRSRAERTLEEVTWVRNRMDAHGSIDFARACAVTLAEAALDEFDVAYEQAYEGEDKRFIREIVVYMIERDL